MHKYVPSDKRLYDLYIDNYNNEVDEYDCNSSNYNPYHDKCIIVYKCYEDILNIKEKMCTLYVFSLSTRRYIYYDPYNLNLYKFS